ncbi:MAG: serine--tRNA ligase [Candidatus Bathyarchaeota archaeon]|nr:MAG: serine--tRNA ligase [Candidatus Bathyarchaeota archaeon]
MLDIKLIREQPDIVKKNLKKRGDFKKLQMLDALTIHDVEWRRLLTLANERRHERRVITKQIANLKKAEKAAEKQIEKGRKLDVEISALEKQVKKHKQTANDILMRLPNLLHASVPIGRNENDNIAIRLWGKPPILDFSPRDHLEIAKNLNLIDEERGAKVAGHGFFYIKGYLVMLDLALQRFAIDFMIEKGYQLVEPPFMLRRKSYEGVTDLSDFENVMYKVEGEDLYMIATAEHPLAAMFMNEVLLKEALPIKLVGVSACFRKEVGSHGKYTKGLFRMHQFNKIEQFIFCHPDNSWDFHEELQQNAEELYQRLGLHHKVVVLCSGDTGTVQAKTYDINIWMADGTYREVGSNSNCTDYQARRLNIRFREKEGQAPKGFLHTINNTALATSRTMLAILEQYQQKDGSVLVPHALIKYMNGLKKLEPH